MARFRPSRLFRRLSSRSDHSSANSSTALHSSPDLSDLPAPPIPIYSVASPRQIHTSGSSLPKLRKRLHSIVADHQASASPPEVPEQKETLSVLPDPDQTSVVSGSPRSGSETLGGERILELKEPDKIAQLSAEELRIDDVENIRQQPVVVVEQATPDVDDALRDSSPTGYDGTGSTKSGDITLINPTPPQEKPSFIDINYSHQAVAVPAFSETTPEPNSQIRPIDTTQRHPSIVDSANARVITTLIDARREASRSTASSNLPTSSSVDFFPPNMSNILQRKIWVRRPGASPTLVQIKEDDLVDDVRDTVLRKYANSLGKTFDAPDMGLYIVTRAEQGQPRTQRLMGPEEEMCKTMDTLYPGGQTIDDALLIDTPQKRTPRPSPKANHLANYYAMDEYRPLENGNDYFPPMPALIQPTIPQTTASNESRGSHHHHSIGAGSADHPRSISVLNTGQIAPLPSPGTVSRRHHNRPKYGRQPTSSPTILSHNASSIALNPPPIQPHLIHRSTGRPRMDSSASEAHGIPPAPPMPTPPATDGPPSNQIHSQPPTPVGGPPTMGSHRFSRSKKPRKVTTDIQSRRKKESSSASSPHLAASGIALLDGSVPPINVLIVEDNIINLRILEGLMKRLKVRWQTAMNGQIAVDKWRKGGFHLVLMDIQMPVMTGLQATKEIRRLERVNGIGVFSSISPSDTEGPNGERIPGEDSAGEGKTAEDNHLPGMAESLFKSPVIIVALTASSLQSDRHEALAAGCNDFLTKPVNFVWLERKVKEWGCMQALIDFEGYRKWRDFAEKTESGKSEAEKQKDREKAEKDRIRNEKMAKLQEKQAARAKEEKEKKKRASLNPGEIASALVSPSLPSGEANGAATSPSTLRPGAEVLSESGIQLA